MISCLLEENAKQGEEGRQAEHKDHSLAEELNHMRNPINVLIKPLGELFDDCHAMKGVGPVVSQPHSR